MSRIYKRLSRRTVSCFYKRNIQNRDRYFHEPSASVAGRSTRIVRANAGLFRTSSHPGTRTPGPGIPKGAWKIITPERWVRLRLLILGGTSHNMLCAVWFNNATATRKRHYSHSSTPPMLSKPQHRRTNSPLESG